MIVWGVIYFYKSLYLSPLGRLQAQKGIPRVCLEAPSAYFTAYFAKYVNIFRGGKKSQLFISFQIWPSQLASCLKRYPKSGSAGPSFYFAASFAKYNLLGMVKEVFYFYQLSDQTPAAGSRLKQGVPRVVVEALLLNLLQPLLNTCCYKFTKLSSSGSRWKILPALAVRIYSNLRRPQSNLFFVNL